MKKILSFSFLVLFFAAMMVSCDDDSSPNIDVAAINTTQESMAKEVPSVTLTQDEMILLTELSNGSPKLSQEQAMEIANNFLNKGTTSSLSKRGTAMPRCEVLTRAKQRISKSGTATDEVDTMLYVFNYDEGYAVISADVRVPEQILAYSDEGNISLDTDNPGIQIFFDMAQDYVVYSIEKSEGLRDSLENSLDEKLSFAMGIPTDTTPSISKAKRVTSKTLVYSNVQSKHENTIIVGPYLKTYWHQNWPYNRYVPLKDSIYCKAGCVAVAFSQLMAFWQRPTIVNGVLRYIWSSMLPPKNDTYAIANLIKDVGTDIHTKYDTSGSGAHTEDAISLLKSYNYIVGNVVKYSFSEVKQSIDNERPVVIDGFRWDANKEKMVGHCWLIDGYAKETWSKSGEKRYVIMYKDDVTGEISGNLEVIPEKGTFSFYYQHFNLGWRKQSSKRGYYLSNVFDVSRENRPDASDKNKLVSTPTRDYGDNDYRYNVRIVPNIYYPFDYDDRF